MFALFNGQFVHDRALALAVRIEKESQLLPEQVNTAFHFLFGRPPREMEVDSCLKHVRSMREHHRNHPSVPQKLPTSVTRQMVEELTGEAFEWTEELVGMRGYQPDLKPWDVGPETRGLAELCLVLLNSNEFLYIR